MKKQSYDDGAAKVFISAKLHRGYMVPINSAPYKTGNYAQNWDSRNCIRITHNFLWRANFNPYVNFIDLDPNLIYHYCVFLLDQKDLSVATQLIGFDSNSIADKWYMQALLIAIAIVKKVRSPITDFMLRQACFGSND